MSSNSTSSSSATSSQYISFVIVGKDDTPLYMAHFGSAPSKDGLPLSQLVLYSSLDVIDSKMWTTNKCNLRIVDKFNNMNISAWITPSGVRLILLHPKPNDDGIKAFFNTVNTMYLKILLNPFYEHNMPITDLYFDRSVRSLGTKLLSG